MRVRHISPRRMSDISLSLLPLIGALPDLLGWTALIGAIGVIVFAMA